MNVWKSWTESKGLNDDIVKYEAKELNECLSRFFAEIRKSDGSDYEQGSLRVMLAAIGRHLKQNDSKISIAKDREIVKCRAYQSFRTHGSFVPRLRRFVPTFWSVHTQLSGRFVPNKLWHKMFKTNINIYFIYPNNRRKATF